jgi:hypothetical protein
MVAVFEPPIDAEGPVDEGELRDQSSVQESVLAGVLLASG